MAEQSQFKVQFKVTEVTTANTLTIEFGAKLRCHVIVNSTPISEKPVIDIVNTIYSISYKNKTIIER